MKRDGFSLIELLVVVAIIGVLAGLASGGYHIIDNTKQDVAETNAQSVERWISSTQIARSGGLTVSRYAREGQRFYCDVLQWRFTTRRCKSSQSIHHR